MGRTRLDALLADLEVLYPGARVSTASGAGAGAPGMRRFRLLVSRRHPRLLVPVDSPEATRAAIRRDSANDRLHDVLGRRAVAAVAGHRLGQRVFRDVVTAGPVGADSVENYLARFVGDAVRLSLHSGAARANAKPVVGVHLMTGAEIGFCKIGITPLAARLVAHESSGLRLLAAAHLTSLDVPAVLHAGQWRGHEVLLMGALRGSRGRGRLVPVEAMREVVQAPGTAVCSLRDSPWTARIGEQLPGAGPEVAARIRWTLDALVTRHGDQPLVHGGCHGDWGPWNMSWSGDRPLVWDWERFTRDTPAGVDAAHFTAHVRLRRIGDLPLAMSAVRDAEEAVRAVLAPWSSAHASEAAGRTVVMVYLVDLATRLAIDAGDAGTALVGRMADWYLEVAARRLQLASTPDEVSESDAAA